MNMAVTPQQLRNYPESFFVKETLLPVGFSKFLLEISIGIY